MPKKYYPYEWSGLERFPITNLLTEVGKYKDDRKTVVTTNGCFDMIHKGHVQFLKNARKEGDVLIVAINSNESVKLLKGRDKPIFDEEDRAEILESFKFVNHVVVFNDLLPLEILRLIKPDIHCKASDYTRDDLPETPIIESMGGKIKILPLLKEYSSSKIIDNIKKDISPVISDEAVHAVEKEYSERIIYQILSSGNLLRTMAYSLHHEILETASLLSQAVSTGNKILICGNGGSSALAQHFASELIGRYKQIEAPKSAVSLTSDTSVITSLGNDFGFEYIFSRQISALGKKGDVVIVISTSGKSRNVIEAVTTAKFMGLDVIALSSKKADSLNQLVDFAIGIPSEDIAIIQQAHLAIIHVWSDFIKKQIHGDNLC